MLDRLLGREELRERIATLEDEKRHLERQLEAEERRRQEAVTDRQAADERINRLEDRIAGLEGERGDESESDDVALDFRRREAIRGTRRERVLSRLESVETDAEGALSAMVDERVPEQVTDLLGDRAALVSRAAPCLVYADDAELVSVALAPPRAPEPFCEWGEAFAVDRSWFAPAPEERHALALVRSDTFALGVYEGTERVSFEGFESDVKEQHSKGGFSQGRFERIRDGQIADHLERCREALDDAPDPLYVTGQRTVLDEFADRAAATRAVDATGDDEESLDDAAAEFWTARLSAL
ncbi:Vms1/Ankzf1 family peptidyl-tRNA hydrolase [Halomarina salina]|uniref:Vms1/Ankzf1 family peptidyl-tRNA hydrolase n=1 Tax=Halomarina salina TaxID=1872699 RepID=A0ABD5RQ39_9EURY|nr:Vms1/Ankzf1 family peptidyl-tRNA hydrolase [Halomarina salina]